MKNESKKTIKKSQWYLNGTTNGTVVTAQEFYTMERGNGNSMNIWTGNIAPIYPSDYGFAVGDPTRSSCTSINQCHNNNWMNKNQFYFTLTYSTIGFNRVFYATPDRYSYFAGVGNYNVQSLMSIYPSLYLNPNIKIQGGLGTSTNPFTLELSE